jgi:hypothetical protein
MARCFFLLASWNRETKWDGVTSLSNIFVVPELEHKLVASLCVLLYSEAFLFGAFAKTVIG